MIQQVRMAVDQETADIIEEVVDRLTEAIQETAGGGVQPEWAGRASEDLAAIAANQDKLRQAIEARASQNAVRELEASIRSQASKLDQLEGVATSAEVSALAGSLNQTLEPAIGSMQQAIPRALDPIEQKLTGLQASAHAQKKAIADLHETVRHQQISLKKIEGVVTSLESLGETNLHGVDTIEKKLGGLEASIKAQQTSIDQLVHLVQQQQERLEAQQNALTTLSKPWYKRLFGG